MDRRSFIRLGLTTGLALTARGTALFPPLALEWSAGDGFPGMPVRIEIPEALGVPGGGRLLILAEHSSASTGASILYDGALDTKLEAWEWRIPSFPRALCEDENLLRARLLGLDGRVVAETRSALRILTRPFRFGV